MNSNGDICPYCGDILPEDGSPCPSCRHLHQRGLPDGADLDTVEQEHALRDNVDVLSNPPEDTLTAASSAALPANLPTSFQHLMKDARSTFKSSLAQALQKGQEGPGEHLLHLPAYLRSNPNNGLSSTVGSTPHALDKEPPGLGIRRIEPDGTLSTMPLSGGDEQAISPPTPRVKRRYVWRGPHKRNRKPKPKVPNPKEVNRNEPVSGCIMCGELYYNTIASSCARCGGMCIVRTLDEMDWMARLNPNLAYLPRL